MADNMKAVRWNANNNTLAMVELPIPDVKDKEVLIKVAYSGVCGTDLHIIQKEFPAAKQLTLGHEIAGTIVKVGNEVSSIKVGARVAVNPNGFCNECDYCLQGNPTHCPVGGLRTTVGICSDGGWADYCIVHVSRVYEVPDSLPLDIAVLCEPMSCLLRGVHNIGPVGVDSSILILGAGIIGLLWASLLHHKGYRDITVSEPSQERSKLAEGLAIGLKIWEPEDIPRHFKDKSVDQDGFHLIVDCSGFPKAIESAFPFLRSGATFCLFGCCPGKSSININPAVITLKELKIIGTIINAFKFNESVCATTAMHTKYLDFSRLGIRKYALQDYEEAIAELRKGSISKAMFDLHADI